MVAVWQERSGGLMIEKDLSSKGREEITYIWQKTVSTNSGQGGGQCTQEKAVFRAGVSPSVKEKRRESRGLLMGGPKPLKKWMY